MKVETTKNKLTAAVTSAYLRFPSPIWYDILSALKELQGSSLKLDFNVSTFAKETLCVPEASDIASRRPQKCDELIRQRSW